MKILWQRLPVCTLITTFLLLGTLPRRVEAFTPVPADPEVVTNGVGTLEDPFTCTKTYADGKVTTLTRYQDESFEITMVSIT